MPLRPVRLSLEVRAHDPPLGQILRVAHHRIDNQPLVPVRLLRNQIEKFSEHRVLAVRNSVAPQIACAQIRRHHFQIPRTRRAAALFRSRTRIAFPHRPFPHGRRHALPGPRARRRCVPEMQQPRLRAEIGLDLQRVLVRPRDVQSRRQSHQTRRAIRPALLARLLVFGLVPRIRHAPPIDGQRNARKIAFIGDDHAPAPIFIDHRDPIARQIQHRARAPRFASAPTFRGVCCCKFNVSSGLVSCFGATCPCASAIATRSKR